MEEDDYLAAAERTAKQQYLKEEIIDANYDPEVFTDYLEKSKGADIDAWTFEELRDCCRSFKNYMRVNPQAKAKAAASSIANQMRRAALEGSSDEEEQKVSGSNPDIIDVVENSLEFDITEINSYDIKDSEIKGVLPPETEIATHVNVKVTLSSPEINSGGFFSKSFIAYNIETQPLGWLVKRRYRNFLWLRT